MDGKLVTLANDILDGLKVTPEQIAQVGGPDGFARLLAQSFIRCGLRLATLEEIEDGD